MHVCVYVQCGSGGGVCSAWVCRSTCSRCEWSRLPARPRPTPHPRESAAEPSPPCGGRGSQLHGTWSRLLKTSREAFRIQLKPFEPPWPACPPRDLPSLLTGVGFPVSESPFRQFPLCGRACPSSPPQKAPSSLKDQLPDTERDVWLEPSSPTPSARCPPPARTPELPIVHGCPLTAHHGRRPVWSGLPPSH